MYSIIYFTIKSNFQQRSFQFIATLLSLQKKNDYTIIYIVHSILYSDIKLNVSIQIEIV